MPNVTSTLYCRMSKLPPAAQSEFPLQAKQQHNSSRPNSSNETTADSQTFHRHNRHSGGCQHNQQPPIEVISDHQVEVHQTSNGLSSASDEADEEDEADEANESLKPIVRRQQPEKQIRKPLTFSLLLICTMYIPIYKKTCGIIE